MNFKVIATDFDGTLCENKWPDIGEPNEEIIWYLREQQAAGVKIILWTCRVGERLEEAVRWCYDQGLIFDAVNENIPEAIDLFGSDTRKIFANEYIDDRSSTRFKLPYVKEESSMSSWADKEVEIACKRERDNAPDGEWNYGCACYESALKAYKSLMKDGHSGFSIGLTKQILNRLIDGKSLTPIEDTDDIWRDISDISGLNDGEVAVYQCKRMSSLFKYVYADGRIEYTDVDFFYCIDTTNNLTYTSGLVRRVMDEMFPISMPYMPTEPIKVYCSDLLTDRKNGDYDTVAILYIIKPNGDRIDINRFFKENGNDWVEITIEEYEQRKDMELKRLQKETPEFMKKEFYIPKGGEENDG